jgi:murein DD-endopeptidase MepM/ murein hydrolase activator NlpD
VYAATTGRVVRVRQGQRDHRSRTSWPALLYLLAEGMVREVLGAGRVVGNHIVIDMGDGRFTLYAHLQRGSATVRAGDQVRAGQQIARCGNSGNSSEPHLHFQVMDRSRPSFAAGLPFVWPAGPPPRNGELLSEVDEPGVLRPDPVD